MTDVSATLAQWRAQEDAVRARQTHPPGIGDLHALADAPGIEVFRRMLNGDWPPPPIAVTMDFMLVEVEPGRAVFQGRPALPFYNPLGSVHGGWFATLLDSALGCAVHSALPAGKAYTTLEFKVNLVRALSERVPLVRAVGTAVHVGSQVATAEARLVDAEGRLYAHASTTCLVFPLRVPTPRRPAA